MYFLINIVGRATATVLENEVSNGIAYDYRRKHWQEVSVPAWS